MVAAQNESPSCDSISVNAERMCLCNLADVDPSEFGVGLRVAVEELTDKHGGCLGVRLCQARTEHNPWVDGNDLKAMLFSRSTHVLFSLDFGNPIVVTVGFGRPVVPITFGEDVPRVLVVRLNRSNGRRVDNSCHRSGFHDGINDVLSSFDGGVHNVLDWVLYRASVRNNSSTVDDDIRTLEALIKSTVFEQISLPQLELPWFSFSKLCEMSCLFFVGCVSDGGSDRVAFVKES
mmetsp:Transcript_145027/g.205248  ORF Transcript_145027/g.205248 Transcript_145027/m.205248 type:complete len:234 (-) Transcript_145027:155-856(-)